MADKPLFYDTTNKIEKAAYIENASTAETDTSKRLAPDGSGGVQWATGGAGIFGSEYAQAESWGSSQTTNTSPQDKVTLNLSGLTASYKYELLWVYETLDDSATTVEARVRDITGSTDHHTSSHAQSIEWQNYRGERQITSISGTRQYKIQYYITGSGTVSIKYARLIWYRVE